MNTFFITLRGIITTIWVWISIFIYSILCYCMLFFSRQAAYKVGVIWCRQVLACGGVKIKVNGLDKIKPYTKYILVCNHQSNLDIASLMSSLPLYLVFIAKKELFHVPFFGWGIKALGHIAIDRSSPRKARASFMKASEEVKKDNQLALVIFPEGTRSPDGNLQEFKHGSFALPLDTVLPVLPVAIKGTYKAWPKNKALIKPAEVIITIGDIIDPAEFSKYEKDKLSAKCREQIVVLQKKC